VRVRNVGAGPLFPDDSPRGKRWVRRVRGIAVEVGGLLVLTVLLPVALVVALLVDIALWVRRRKPFMAVRLVLMAELFLLNELHGLLTELYIFIVCAGRDSPRRRRLMYGLRIRWATIHLGAIRTLFGLRFSTEGLELAGPAPVTVLIRHASIIDNMVPDAVLAREHGLGLRYVIKRELQMLPPIDIGGRWVPTCFVRRASADSAAEIAALRTLAHDMGGDEGLLIYPEGTRWTPEKLARAQEIIGERQPDVAPLADRLHNLLPPRLGGPLALLDEARGIDVVVCGHVGLDGFEYISDIWSGALVNAEVKIKLWRYGADEVPEGERELTEWLYEVWQTLDDWVGAQRGQAAAATSASAASLRT
jgi:1-acyl-sn-glycerol-3-phosphate acyltransferase